MQPHAASHPFQSMLMFDTTVTEAPDTVLFAPNELLP